MQRTVLAHELTHALDDQHVGLRELTDTAAIRTQDAEIVLSSLGEGSATSLMFHYLAGQTAAGKINALEAMAYFGREMERVKALGQMPRYFTAMFGSYLIGAAFLAKGDLQAIFTLPDDRATGDNFRAAWAARPRSSEQILHPEKYWNEAQRDEPIEIDDAGVAKWLARSGRHVIHRDTLGELLTSVVTQPKGMATDLGQALSATAWTNPGAIGWGGDRFYLLAAGATATTAARDLKGLQGVWVTAWDSDGERAEFVRALEAGQPPAGYAIGNAGERLAVVFVGFDAAERQSLMEKLHTSPLRLTKQGRAWR
jgi:hypothetical protein